MHPFAVTVVPGPPESSAAVFHLKGDLNAESLRELEQLYAQEPAASRHKWVIDLSLLDYISSAGLGSFIGVVSDLRNEGGDLIFVGASQRMQRVLKMVGFTRIFKFYENEGEALRA